MVEACQIAAHSLTSNRSYLLYRSKDLEFIRRWKKTASSLITNSLEHEITAAAVIVSVMKIGRQYLCNTNLQIVLNLMGTWHTTSLQFHGKLCKCKDTNHVWTQWTKEIKHIQDYLPQFLNRNFIIISHLISKKIFLKIILMPDSPQGNWYTL